MVFEGPDGSLGCVAASVNSRRGQLIVNGFVIKELFQGRCTFIVKAGEFGSEACVHQGLVCPLIGTEDLVCCSVFDWFCVDVVGVVII